jgi:hypothetical protein
MVWEKAFVIFFGFLGGHNGLVFVLSYEKP